jgi:hypothetical protein
MSLSLNCHVFVIYLESVRDILYRYTDMALAGTNVSYAPRVWGRGRVKEVMTPLRVIISCSYASKYGVHYLGTSYIRELPD